MGGEREGSDWSREWRRGAYCCRSVVVVDVVDAPLLARDAVSVTPSDRQKAAASA